MYKQTSKNYFKEELRTFSRANDAWDLGENIFNSARRGDYKELTEKECFDFLDSAKKIQLDNGLIMLYLYEEFNMPTDARVGIIYQPSYAVVAMAIYTYNKYKDKFDYSYKSFLNKLINASFRNGIQGHGFEAYQMIVGTIKILSDVDARKYASENEGCEKLLSVIEHYTKALRENIYEVD